MKRPNLKIIPFCLTVCAALLLCNCDSITTTQALSLEPKAIDKEMFEGAWRTDDEDGIIQVKFSSDGTAHLAALDWKEDHFQMEKLEMIVVEGNDHNFISVRIQEDGKWQDGYSFAQYTFTSQGDLILWAPNADAFKEAIKKKTLEGTSKKQGKYSSEIKITSPPEEVLKFLNTPDKLQPFLYKEPIVLRKIASPKKDN